MVFVSGRTGKQLIVINRSLKRLFFGTLPLYYLTEPSTQDVKEGQRLSFIENISHLILLDLDKRRGNVCPKSDSYAYPNSQIDTFNSRQSQSVPRQTSQHSRGAMGITLRSFLENHFPCQRIVVSMPLPHNLGPINPARRMDPFMDGHRFFRLRCVRNLGTTGCRETLYNYCLLSLPHRSDIRHSIPPQQPPRCHDFSGLQISLCTQRTAIFLRE